MTAQQLQDQHILVTGAAGGIGQALCAELSARGARVAALDRDQRGLERLAKQQPGLEILRADLTQERMLARKLATHAKRHGAFDGLVSNAAVFCDVPTLARTTPASWQQEIDGNLTAAFNVARALLPACRRKKRGSLVFIASVNALSFLGHPAYSAAKAAVVSYAGAIAVEYGKHNIRSNVLLPGTVATPAWRARLRRNPKLFKQLRKWYPLGRVVDPNEVARAACFLLSDDAAAVSGACLTVDCGLSAGVKPMASELTQAEF